MNPTQQQQAVIDHKNGRAVVFAVAGSGKTSTMAYRIVNLIDSGVAPNRILATTFGREAKAQILKKLNDFPQCKKVNVRTLQSVASRVINFDKDKGELYQQTQVDSNDNLDDHLVKCFYEIKNKIKEEAKRETSTINISPWVYESNIRDFGWDDFKKFIDQIKGDLKFTNKGFNELTPNEKNICSIYEFPKDRSWLEEFIDIFEEERKNRKLEGYIDLQLRATLTLYRNSELRHEVSKTYDYIFVDEYQDVNAAQEYMMLAIDGNNNLMVIGDDDQTIYEWRGAAPHFIRDKYVDNKNWQTYKLDKNFRSVVPQIVLGSQVIKHNSIRTPKKMIPVHSFNVNDNNRLKHKIFDSHISIDRCGSDIEQANKIIEEIKNSKDIYGNYGNIVILIRRYDETPIIEHLLIENRIKYEIPGSVPFYLRPLSKKLLAYIEIIKLEFHRHYKKDEQYTPEQRRKYKDCWENIYASPTRYISKQQIRNIVAYSESHRDVPIFEIFKKELNTQNRRPNPALDRLMNFLEYHNGSNPSIVEAAELIADIDEKLEFRDYIINSSVTKEVGLIRSKVIDGLMNYCNTNSIEQVLRDLERIKQLNQTAAEKPNSDSSIRLLTVFKAKGLEFPSVIIPNMNSAATDIRANVLVKDNTSEKEEERRIFYVAITRAMHNLSIYYTSEQPSQFLTEAGYKDVIRVMDNAKLIYYGEINQIENNPEDLFDIRCFFCEYLLPYFKIYQLGYSCAQAWARLSEQKQEETYLFGLKLLNKYKSEYFEELNDKQLKNFKLICDLWENINLNAKKYRSEHTSIPAVEIKENESIGDIKIFDTDLDSLDSDDGF